MFPIHLQCGYAIDPLGVSNPRPALSWRLNSDQRGARQTAFRLIVASSKEKAVNALGDLWDSGVVTSDATRGVRYAGKALTSSNRVYWRVRVWDEHKKMSPWSPVATWTMGILKPEDWAGAKWLSDPEVAKQEVSQSPKPAVSPNATARFRREFAVQPGLKRAVIHVCGIGQSEITVNGRRVSEGLMTPAWSYYSKTRYYETYDVTPLLQAGANAAGIEVASGFYSVAEGRYVKLVTPFKAVTALAQIHLEYADGRVETIVTDDQWREKLGPVTFSNMYGGEDYDARAEEHGWDMPGFKESNWQKPAVLSSFSGRLIGAAEGSPPFKVMGDLKQVAARHLTDGVTVYDFGQNVSMMIQLKVRGPAGSKVKIIPAELLHPDGTVDRSSCGGGEASWNYTLAGDLNGEVWEPRFFYHGSRYLEVHTEPADHGAERPIVLQLTSKIVHSDSPPAGRFSCSNELFNRIESLIRWAQRSNLAHVITDCPHRERLGWLEQYHLNGPALRYEWDIDRLFNKTLVDMQDSQLTNGLVPDIAPEYTEFSGGFRDSPEWGSAYVIVPWDEYQWTGDLQPLSEHFEGMRRYVDFLGATARGNIVDHGLGDWYDLGPNAPGFAQLTPIALTATAFYYCDAKIVAQAAELLGKAEEAAKYAALAEEIREAFNLKFFDRAKGTYAGGSQTANAIPLVMGLAEPQHGAETLRSLVEDVRAHGNSVTAGDVGHRYLLRALADNDRSDVVFAIHSQTDRPGYGYILKKGATSLTEGWDGSSSQNHFMLGHITEWFFHDVLGIRLDPAAPGFKHTIIKPCVAGDLTWAKGSYDSVHGQIKVDWRLSGGKFLLDVTIPANTSADVYLPTSDLSTVTEGLRPATKSPGVQRTAEGAFRIGAGSYHFESPR